MFALVDSEKLTQRNAVSYLSLLQVTGSAANVNDKIIEPEKWERQMGILTFN